MTKLLLAALLSICFHQSVHAWGQEGHSAIGEIAQRRLSPVASIVIADLLGPGHSLASISSWADDIRNARPYSYNWHFTDIPITRKTYDASTDCIPNAEKGDCVVAELLRLREELSCSASPKTRSEALKWVVHFIGDIHQPMHTVDDGNGANLFPALITAKGLTGKTECTSNCKKSNLHAVWDSDLIKKTVWSWGALADRVEAILVPLSTEDPIDPVQWANETHGVAIKIWDWGKPQDPKEPYLINEAYWQQAEPIVEQQIGRAGLRLAAFLNSVLVTSANCAASP